MKITISSREIFISGLSKKVSLKLRGINRSLTAFLMGSMLGAEFTVLSVLYPFRVKPFVLVGSVVLVFAFLTNKIY